MNQRQARRHGWRRRTKVSLLIVLIVASGLIYWEQTAVLYLLSTLFICTLLSLVAFADLEGREKELSKPVQSEAQGASPTVLAPEEKTIEEQLSKSRESARSRFSLPSENMKGTDGDPAEVVMTDAGGWRSRLPVHGALEDSAVMRMTQATTY